MTRRTGRTARLLALLVLSGLPATVRAQTPPVPPPAREGSVNFAYVGTTGNSSTQTFGLGGELIYRPSPWEMKVKAAYIRDEAEDQLRAQSIVATFHAQRRIEPHLAAYGQYGYQRDRFAGIENRHTAEAGLAYALIDRVTNNLVIDGGVGYANEHRLIGNDLSTATLSAGGVYLLKLSPTSAFTEDGHFVFSLPDGTDWRYANAAALTATLTSVFSLKLSNTIRYVHLPAAGFRNTDVVTAAALVAKF
jgi:putative salt-induced outer membrane protein